MIDPLPRIPTSKWRKHILLGRHESLSHHLPDTSPFTLPTLASYLRSHSCVVIKPEWGGGGRHVCRICKTRRGYAMHSGDRRWRAAHFRDLASVLPPWILRRPAIVQRHIALLPFRGQLTDVRAIVQRNEMGRFEVTGTFAKSAPPGRFVTNVKQGGTIVRLGKYLRAIAPGEVERAAVQSQIETLARTVGDYLGVRFRNSVYGIDLGVDLDSRVWIIEVNTRPSLNILADIDQRMHSRATFLRRRSENESLASFSAPPRDAMAVSSQEEPVVPDATLPPQTPPAPLGEMADVPTALPQNHPTPPHQALPSVDTAASAPASCPDEPTAPTDEPCNADGEPIATADEP